MGFGFEFGVGLESDPFVKWGRRGVWCMKDWFLRRELQLDGEKGEWLLEEDEG